MAQFLGQTAPPLSDYHIIKYMYIYITKGVESGLFLQYVIIQTL